MGIENVLIIYLEEIYTKKPFFDIRVGEIVELVIAVNSCLSQATISLDLLGHGRGQYLLAGHTSRC